MLERDSKNRLACKSNRINMVCVDSLIIVVVFPYFFGIHQSKKILLKTLKLLPFTWTILGRIIHDKSTLIIPESTHVIDLGSAHFPSAIPRLRYFYI